jgi:hypothetical protein
MLSRTTCLLLTLAVGTAYGAPAEDVSTLTAEQRLERLEKRFSELESRYQAEVTKKETQINTLQNDLAETRKKVAAQDEAWTNSMRAEQTRDLTNDIIADINTRQAAEPINRAKSIMNPDIAVITDFLGNASTRRVNGSRNRFDVREVEVDIRAAIDPRADGVLILAFERDTEFGLFEAEDIEGPDTEVAVEEGYVFLHDFGVPNLTAKIGRYRTRFGRQNVNHLHDLATVDYPFAIQNFLGPEGYTDSGLSISYVIPNPLNEYIEGIVEVNSGEGTSSESPLLTGDVNSSAPSVISRLLWNKNLAKNLNLELGGSMLWGPSSNEDNRQAWLFGGDATLIHRDPTGGFNNRFLQAEVMYGKKDGDEGMDTATAFGGYLLGQQQLHKNWYTGLRLDYTQDINDSSQAMWGVSPYITWNWSEFLRFRVQYQYRDGDVPSENLLFFQVTWVFGAHPAHPYWSMK